MLLVDVIFNSNLHKSNSNNLITSKMITIIILAYVVSIFINRWMNKVLREHAEIVPIFWFIPIATTIAYIIIYFQNKEVDSPFSNWFTGKNWD